jgi:DNA-binding GntR family transcriptional regulator
MKLESIADIAKRNIQEWIVTGRFLPGEQLKEEEISQRLDISRPPVREALKALEATGLVIRKPRRGVFVPEMTEKDMWEIYTLKATLYEMAVGLAMEVITAKEIERLESLVKGMDACVTEEPFDVIKYQRLHGTFHKVIMEISGNTRLKTIASHLHNQVTMFSYKTLQDKDHLQSSLHYHWEILDAIKEKNTFSACKLMKEHVLNALTVLCNSVGEVCEANK